MHSACCFLCISYMPLYYADIGPDRTSVTSYTRHSRVGRAGPTNVLLAACSLAHHWACCRLQRVYRLGRSCFATRVLPWSHTGCSGRSVHCGVRASDATARQIVGSLSQARLRAKETDIKQRLHTYAAYSVGCAIVWAGILALVRLRGDEAKAKTIYLVCYGWWLGWISASIARLVYPPPRARRKPRP
jgi:hypothetical protein